MGTYDPDSNPSSPDFGAGSGGGWRGASGSGRRPDRAVRPDTQPAWHAPAAPATGPVRLSGAAGPHRHRARRDLHRAEPVGPAHRRPVHPHRELAGLRRRHGEQRRPLRALPRPARRPAQRRRARPCELQRHGMRLPRGQREAVRHVRQDLHLRHQRRGALLVVHRRRRHLGGPDRQPPLHDGIVVALHGAWHGPALELHSPDNSWTEAFTPAGAIRPDISTANMGTATTTIRYGSENDFQSACQRLAA